MTATWGIFDTAWSNFENWWNSSASAWFKFVLVVWIAVVFVNVIVYVRGRRERKDVEISPGRILGRVLAVLGGLITLIGLFMPWESIDASLPEYYNPTFPGDGAWLVLVFGLLWFTFFAVPKESAAILGFVWGSLALVLTVQALKGIADLAVVNGGAVYVGYGLYVSILGSCILIVGSVLAFVKAKQTKKSEPIPSDVAVPPIP